MAPLTVAETLCGPPTDADGAHATLPRESGLYAWWAPPGSLSDGSGPAHPSVDGLELLYVGLAQNLRTRVGRNHLRGPTGSSTLRRALVAPLMSSEGYRTRWTTDRVVPVDADEERLSDWMRAHRRTSRLPRVGRAPTAAHRLILAEARPRARIARVTRYRASVTYTVEVVDQAAVSAAGAAAWRAADGGWAVKVEEDGRVVEATAEEAAAARPDAEASIALALGQQGYPSVPGVQFHTMSVDVVTAAPEKE